ncbi:MAG: hypothetical protein LC797_02365 [Chloroflexi bacterium]|nr:hypothetical protein [Chloroflexota bacterium]
MNSPSSSCPDLGAWRAWLDREDESPLLDEHLAACPGCQRVFAELRDDAAAVGEALAMLAPDQASVPSADAVVDARAQLEWRRRRSTHTAAAVAARAPRPMFLRRITTSGSGRIAAGGVAAALVLSLLIAVTPDGRALASGFLAQFRSEQLTAIEVTPQTQGEIMKTLNSLGNLGTVNTPSGLASRPEAALRGAAEQTKTASLAEASQAVGFKLQTPDPATLPAGLGAPRVQVMPAGQVRFTFDKSKASAYFTSTGHPEVTLPDKFDGATLVVSLPAAALMQYSNTATKDALIIGQAGELVVDVEGKVSLDEMRDFLLGLPGLPPTVVSQLRQIKKWNQTLPIPIPVDQVNWQSTTFNGYQGLLLNDNSGAGSAAIWYARGHMSGVAGSFKATELKRIADGLAGR